MNAHSGTTSPFSVEAQPESGYLLLIVRGNLGKTEDLERYALAVQSEAARLGITEVLLDERALELTLDVQDLYFFANDAAPEAPLGLAMKCASVVSEENLELMTAAELLLRNRFFEFRVFTDMDAAEAWLESSGE